MSGCGVEEEGGAEVGTVERERGSWRQITSEPLQAKAEPSGLLWILSPLSPLLFCVFMSPHGQNLVSKSFCYVSPLSFLRMTEAAGAQEFRPVNLPFPITPILSSFPLSLHL